MDWSDINIFYDEQAGLWDLHVFDQGGWKHVDYFCTQQAATYYADENFIAQNMRIKGE